MDAMQTPDGAWRVEVVRRGHTHWYRILHSESEIDWLSIAAVERILDEAGINMADLIETTAQRAGLGDHPAPGVAET
jgi:bifunctional non-homologous end joining protein LigD